ncbi:hypothetical protein YB2330_000289 [Saitoella coloradoensis]
MATLSQPQVSTAESVKIVMLGDGGVGKSALTMSLIRSRFVDEYDPTIEDSYSTTRTIDGRNYTLDISDTAGQEEYRGLWASQHLNTADAFILVYDITSHESLEALDYFDSLIVSAFDVEGSKKPVKIIVGNKCDLASDRRVTSEEGLGWARSRGAGFMESSAKLRVNVEETFALLVKRVVEAREGGGVRASPRVNSPARSPVVGHGAAAREEEKAEAGCCVIC